MIMKKSRESQRRRSTERRKSRESRFRRKFLENQPDIIPEPSQLPEDPCPTYANIDAKDGKAWAQDVIRVGSGPLISRYKEIRRETVRPSPQLTITACDANNAKNRYEDVRCWDHTRVKLSGQNDYVHASFVDGYSRYKEFICAQGPMETTKEDFWNMIWEHNVQGILMLCQFKEDGKEKCAQYFPVQEGMGVRMGQFRLKNKQCKLIMLNKKLKVRQVWLELQLKEEKRRHVVILKHESWPDQGTPPCAYPTFMLLDFIRQEVKMKDHPIVVHCSAGVGRTGTLVAVDVCLQKLRHSGDVNVEEVVRLIRLQRMQAIQTEGQFLFIHKVLLEYMVKNLGYSLKLDRFK